MPETLTSFSLDNFNALADYLTVNSEGDIDVTFRNGQTIRAWKKLSTTSFSGDGELYNSCID